MVSPRRSILFFVTATLACIYIFRKQILLEKSADLSQSVYIMDDCEPPLLTSSISGKVSEYKIWYCLLENDEL